ncbi:TetR family transcriptional regulator C-terminal domain-containing protein [Nocardia jinanensis]|uniref:Tetracyclin repressor-like C-terminal domain-containing protein n=1 Tax=Nocardia jinanensis TaxID=382504 RepID=A0A917VXU3_9NOCA|nr:hypothetical protein [Nocardia jinanensis]GGL42016.1 hypothetical protein GCM10011588_65960 [Nocardia jinanensis]
MHVGPSVAHEGGCFFISTAPEFDTRPGRVRDALASARRDWHTLYTTIVTEAQQLGEIRPEIDPADLSFELDALARIAAEDAALLDDNPRYDRARRIIANRLHQVATDTTTLDHNPH